MGAPLARGDRQFDSVGERDQADVVVVAYRGKRQQGAEFGGGLVLQLTVAAERSGSGQVDYEPYRQFTFLYIALDERPTHASRHVPVDAADLVPRRILSHLFEFHPAALEDAAVFARQHRVDSFIGLDLDQPDLLGDASREILEFHGPARSPKALRTARARGLRRHPARAGRCPPNSAPPPRPRTRPSPDVAARRALPTSRPAA